MVVESLTELGEALGAKNYDRILGTREAEWIDFKGGPYSLAGDGSTKLTSKGRWELCKDVAAFANLNGGCLVLGIATEKDPNIGVDMASRVTTIRTEVIDVGAYRKILDSGITPPIQRVRIEWHLAEESSDQGLLVIEIPAQSDRDKPFIVKRMPDESNRETESFGIPFRNGDQTDWYTAERIHSLIQSLPPGFALPSTRVETVPRVRDLDEPINSIEETQSWEDLPVFFLQAIPEDAPELVANFYGDEGVVTLLQNWRPIRSAGFNFFGLQQGEFIDGNLLLRRMDDAGLRLDKDGVLTLGVSALPAFLGWAVNVSWGSGDPIRVNSTALVEITMEFCRFVHLGLLPKLGIANWRYRILCLRFKSHDVRLMSGAPALHWMFQPMTTASSDHWEHSIAVGDDAESDAFRILTLVYGLFSLGPEAIPHSDGVKVSEAKLQALG